MMFHYEREPVSPLRRRFIDDLRLRNKSPRTIETYVLRVVQFTRVAVMLRGGNNPLHGGRIGLHSNTSAGGLWVIETP